MSYSLPIEASSKGIYAMVVNDFYTNSAFNPVTNRMTSVSTFPLQTSLLPAAAAMGTSFTESLTCMSQNPAYNCTNSNDCPGPQSSCGRCIQHKCR